MLFCIHVNSFGGFPKSRSHQMIKTFYENLTTFAVVHGDPFKCCQNKKHIGKGTEVTCLLDHHNPLQKLMHVLLVTF